MTLSRRDCLSAALLAGAAAVLPASAWAGGGGAVGGSPSLDQVARRRGLRFGSAIGATAFRDPQVQALVASQASLIVPENELKWYAVHRRPGAYDFTQADRLLDYAQKNGLEMRGHNLLWHNVKWLPKWVSDYDFGPRPAASAEALLTDHIRTVMGRYKGRIHSWDVVNETIDHDTGAMRQTVFTQALGDRVIDIAYHAAREADPSCQLVYNDYMSWEAGNEAHRTGVLRLLERLKKDGVPVDALGLQSHIGTDNSDASKGFDTAQPKAWKAFLDEVTGMGYGLLITEFDVHDKGLPAAIPARDQVVADYARRYLDLTLSYPQLTHVLTWGLVDKYSWLQTEWLRPDRLEKRPLPYDDAYRAVPLRQAMIDAFAAAPMRALLRAGA